MNYIIVDLEATCWEGSRLFNNEIIEIGALKINEEGSIVSEFSAFVKPLKHPILSEFCKELTSISQSEVDQANYFPEVVAAFQEWIGVGQSDYLLCSWGFYDQKQFEADCKLYGLDFSWTLKHISLKHQHAKIRKLKRAIGMKNALKLEKLNLEGTHHRGIDDARNIAKIFLKHFDHWDFGNKS